MLKQPLIIHSRSYLDPEANNGKFYFLYLYVSLRSINISMNYLIHRNDIQDVSKRKYLFYLNKMIIFLFI